MESDLIVAVGGHLFEIAVPRLARIETKLVARLAGQQVPSAFDVLRREGRAVVRLRLLAFPMRAKGAGKPPTLKSSIARSLSLKDAGAPSPRSMTAMMRRWSNW
jgi:hypothetical protein